MSLSLFLEIFLVTFGRIFINQYPCQILKVLRTKYCSLEVSVHFRTLVRFWMLNHLYIRTIFRSFVR